MTMTAGQGGRSLRDEVALGDEHGDATTMTDALGEHRRLRGADGGDSLLDDAGMPAPVVATPVGTTPPGEATTAVSGAEARADGSAPGPASGARVHDISARLAQVHATTSPLYPAEARARRHAGRDMLRGPLNWVARLSPTARLSTDLVALLVTYQFVVDSRTVFPSLPFHLPAFPLELLFVVYLPILALLRLYSPPQGVHHGSLVSELPRLVAGSAIAAAFMAVILGQRLDLGGAALTASFTLLGLVAFRSVLHVAASLLRRRGYGIRKTLIVGTGHSVASLVGKVGRRPEIGLRVVGVISQDTDEHGVPDHGAMATIAGRPEDLPEIVTRLGIEQLILVPEEADTKYVADCFMAVDGFKVQASLVPPLQDFLLSPRNVEQIEGIPLISLGRLSYAPRMMPGKRVFDILGATLALLVLSPLFVLTSLAIKIDDRGPVFFKQKRAGYRGRYFKMIKFRSMCVDAESKLAGLSGRNESDGLLFKIKDDPRITRVGSLIRKTSLDELPQFINVLKGDMSLVGPRALPVEVEHFGDIAIKRLNVRPGVTGYWQVLGRSDLTYDEMVKLDLAYIQNWSIWVDIQLMLKTIPVIFGRKGAY